MDVCVSVSAGLAVSDTARCSPTRWASGSPCGNAPGDQRSGTPDHGSAPAHTKTHRQRDHIRMVVISCHSCMCTCNPTPRLYLSMWINQQHVTHGGSLHTTEDILTRGRAALSDQEIPTTGEEWLRLLSSYPVMKNTVSEKGGKKKLLIVHEYWDVNYQPAMKPALLLDQVLDLRERSALLSSDLTLNWVWWRYSRRRMKENRRVGLLRTGLTLNQDYIIIFKNILLQQIISLIFKLTVWIWDYS